MRINLSTLTIIGLLTACSGVSGLPDGWRKDISSEIPSDPIVTESGTEVLGDEAPQESKDPNADVPLPAMLVLGEDCQAVGAMKAIDVTDANASVPITIEGNTLVRIATKRKTISITSLPVVDTLCISSNGIGNTVNLVMKMRVSKLYLTTNGASETWSVVTDVEGWTTNTTLVVEGEKNAFKFSGDGNFDCPRTDQVKVGSVVECVAP